jgi:phosphohistidine phosphatase SixA
MTRQIILGIASLIAALASPAMAQSSVGSAAQDAAKPSAPSSPEPLGIMELAKAVRSGGYILAMRHERTGTTPARDDYSRPESECRSQRNLSLAGIASAVETGEALRKIGVPVVRVLYSPMCRTMDTATHGFGGWVTRVDSEPLLMHHNNVPGRDAEAAGKDMRNLIQGIEPGGSNIVLVTHIVNILAGLGPELAEGEIAVFKKQADGTAQFIGKALGSEWSLAARNADRLK